MLFPDDATMAARQRWYADYRSGKIPAEKFWRKLFDLDPDDALSHIELGKLRMKAKDWPGARDLLWRAIQLQPLLHHGYLPLAESVEHVGPDQEPLAWALRQLGCQKMSRVPDDADAVDLTSDLPDSNLKQFIQELSPSERLQVLAAAVGNQVENEPADVTSRLRPARLLELLHATASEGAELSADLVDQIVAEGPVIVPWLVGALRGYAQGTLKPAAEPVVECALALLGEIGEPSAVPALCEFLDDSSNDLHGAAEWALDRILRNRPAESVPMLARVASDLPHNTRLYLALRLALHPQLIGVEAVYERLATQIDRIPKEVRADYLHDLLLAFGKAPCGSYALGRRLLRRASSALSRSARLESEDLLLDLNFTPSTYRIPPSPWTIYDICAGKAEWERSDDEESTHAGKDEFDTLRSRLSDFIPLVLGENESRKAVMEFGTAGREDVAQFVDWIIHDRLLPHSSRNLIEEYLHRHVDTLTSREQEILNAWSASYVGLYEVQQITPGAGIEVKSLLDGGALFVHDLSASNQMSLWDVLLARIVLGRRGNELSGIANIVPRPQVNMLRGQMEAEKTASGLSWPRYLKKNWPAIRRQVYTNSEDWMSGIKLQNTDGEDLLISAAEYRVLDQVALTAALEARPDLFDESDGDYTWLKGSKEETGLTVLGKFTLRAGKLSVECNSKERLGRARKMLSKAAPRAIEHVRDTFTKPSQTQLKRQIGHTRLSEADSEVPPEEANRIIAQFQERHYATWPDTKLPALNGKTPRQAVKTAAGRRQVETLLRDFENAEDRNRKQGRYAFDFSRLRAELGL